MEHSELVEKAKVALRAVELDKSVPREKMEESLRELRKEVDDLLGVSEFVESTTRHMT